MLVFAVADYKLADMLGVAGATIGIIIAAGIMLQTLSTRYIGLFERYRGLTHELRDHGDKDSRQGRLRQQVVSYRRQISYLNYATLSVTVAVLCFLLTVGVASLSVIFPEAMILRTVGTIGLFLGLGLIGVGMFLMLLETVVQRPSIKQEAADIDELPTLREAVRS